MGSSELVRTADWSILRPGTGDDQTLVSLLLVTPGSKNRIGYMDMQAHVETTPVKGILFTLVDKAAFRKRHSISFLCTVCNYLICWSACSVQQRSPVFKSSTIKEKNSTISTLFPRKISNRKLLKSYWTVSNYKSNSFDIISNRF